MAYFNTIGYGKKEIYWEIRSQGSKSYLRYEQGSTTIERQNF